MDAAKNKALFRAKLNAQKKEKRIDSPLVRYNELDQPVCRVCNVVLKHESQWDAHQASRKHNEAINNLKANVAERTNAKNVKSEPPPTEPNRSKRPHEADVHDTQSEPSSKFPKAQSALPSDFFDSHDSGRQTSAAQSAKLSNTKSEPPAKLSNPHSSSTLPSDFFDNKESEHKKRDAVKTSDLDTNGKSGSSARSKLSEPSLDKKLNEYSGNKVHVRHSESAADFAHAQTENFPSEPKQLTGALPEGFFDDKEADLRARGIKPVKPDVKDEYKEFEKLIREDLQEVDNRLEEDEIDAAVTIEEAESLEQKSHMEKVESLKKKKMELLAAKSANRSSGSMDAAKGAGLEESSSDDDSDDNFSVDWRAQHL